MTVMENLHYFCGMKMMTVQQINQFADVWLEKLDITTKKNAYVGTLSGGQKRKL
jgi:ABC-type multidrug transport system ATPase subunit